MRRPHPYLALAGACAAVAILTISALACPAEAQRVKPTDIEVLPVINGHPVWPGSVECAPRTDRQYVPTVQRANMIREFTRRTIEMDLDTKALTTPLTYEAWRELIKLDFGQRFTDRPVYVMGQVPPGYQSNCVNEQGQPRLCICSSGVGYLVPSIDTSDPSRVEALLVWEGVNSRLGLLNRADLFDSSSYVGSVTRRVEQWLGGWKQE